MTSYVKKQENGILSQKKRKSTNSSSKLNQILEVVDEGF